MIQSGLSLLYAVLRLSCSLSSCLLENDRRYLFLHRKPFDFCPQAANKQIDVITFLIVDF